MGKAALFGYMHHNVILMKGSPDKASRHKAHFFADNKQNPKKLYIADNANSRKS